jgi:hypothetical protein
MRWVRGLALVIATIAGTIAPAFSAEAPGCYRTWINGAEASLSVGLSHYRRAQAQLDLDMRGPEADAFSNDLMTAWTYVGALLDPLTDGGASCNICDPYKTAPVGQPDVPASEWNVIKQFSQAVALAQNGAQLNPNMPIMVATASEAVKQFGELIDLADRPYCADTSFASKPKALAEVTGKWLFTVPENGTINPSMVLTDVPDRYGFRVDGGYFNESYWWYLNGKIIFVNQDGEPGTVLQKVNDNKWQGKAEFGPFTLILSRKDKPKPDPAQPDPIGPGKAECFAGATYHTAGPRKGKRYNTEICIQWDSEPCTFDSSKIVDQDVSVCVPGKRVRGEAAYTNGKSVLWDLEIDPSTGNLGGRWSQSDGARGVWEPE